MAVAPSLKALRDDDFIRLRPTQADYNRMIAERKRELREITEDLAHGRINPGDWADRFDSVLMTGHSRAWHLGRKLAGDFRGFNTDDMLAGRAAKDGEAEFLQDFEDALQRKDPKFFDKDGNLRISPVMNRAELYIGKMRGTAAEAFVAASPDDDEFDWLLGPVREAHCEDCPRYAALSPYTKDTMPAYPASGSSSCLGNCKCYIRRRSDRIACFKADDVAATPGSGDPARQTIAPVSDALQNSAPYPISVALNEVINTIDQIHTDGALPNISIYGRVLSTGELGWLNPRTQEIIVGIVSDQKAGTLVHEIGHGLDLWGLGKFGVMSSPKSRLLAPFRKAVRKTEAFKRITAIARGESITVDGFEVQATPARIKYATYLLKWEEFWARAYHQFIVRRTSNPQLNAEWAELINSWGVKYTLEQWSDADFAEVDAAMHELFVSRGWMTN